MDARGTTGYALRGWPRDDPWEWNRVIKHLESKSAPTLNHSPPVEVKYGDALKRFNPSVNGQFFYNDMPALRLKIARAFEFSPDAEFALTYTDEDGDVVMLDDDNDLRDVAINQKLNPLRINVHLKSSDVGATRMKQQATNSISLRSTSLEAQLALLKSAKTIDEALKSVPEQVPAVFANLSRDLHSRPASSSAELLDHIVNLLPQSVDGSQKSVMTGSASEPSGVQFTGVPEACIRSVLSEDTSTKIEQVSLCPSDEQSSGGTKSDLKQSADTVCKIKSYSQLGRSRSKGKSFVPSVPPTAPVPSCRSTPTRRSVLVPSMGEEKLPCELSSSYTSYGSNGTANGGNLQSLFLPTVYPPSSDGINSFRSSYRSLGSNCGSIPQRAQHTWIQCDGCRVTPIIGTRYKSIVKENYDLCGACFFRIGNEAEYKRLDKPTSTSNMNILGRTQAVRNDCHLIKDVTVPDGTPMAPSTPFTKIWRLRNSGSTMWPYGTQLVWECGDHLACLSSVTLAISVNGGLNPCEETDVTVDFLAPAKPGRYKSYWRLALPSGITFGQRIWVYIQVGQCIQTSGIKQAAAINLNRLLEASSSKLKPFTFDMNSVPANPFFGCPGSFCETMKPMESEPAPSCVSSVPTIVEQVQIPVTEAPALSTESALASMPTCLPAPEAIPMPSPVPVPPVIALADTATVVPAPEAAPTAPAEPIIHLEEKLISDLEDLGFMQADLNKQILRENNYDLEQSIVDLCGFNEWDPCLEEFSELGSDDSQICKEEVVAVADNSDDEGFIVTDIVTKVKEQ